MGFFNAFIHVLSTMMQIILIVLGGLICAKRNIITAEITRGLGYLVINFFLPCLIFSHFINKFRFDLIPNWWIYPLLGIVVSLLGVILGWLFLLLSPKDIQKREFITMIAFQNCGYLPLVLVQEMFLPELADQLFIVIFLFIQGFNLIFWSIGVKILDNQKKNSLRFHHFINMPFVALILSFFVISIKAQTILPNFLMRSTEMLGQCALPLALLVLGAILARGAMIKKNNLEIISKVVFLKLLIMPLLGLAIFSFISVPYVMALLIMIQLTMPTAVNVGVVAYSKNSHYEMIVQVIFWTHVFAVITIPFFLSLIMVYKP